MINSYDEWKMMSPSRIILLVSAVVLVGLAVFSPHWSYPYPYHVDEWYHIAQAQRLSLDNLHPESGFHLFLSLLQSFDLVKIYQWLPALWSVFSALTLFWLVYARTKWDFWLAWWSVIFFATIKSNVNLLGLWFFTPLSFAIPFIYLYVYFFTVGVERQSGWRLFISLTIMIGLIPIHAISVLFALPWLVAYVWFFHRPYLNQHRRFFSAFLLVPLFGLVFYRLASDLTWGQLLGELNNHLWFKYGWGVLELTNSPLELYSFIGYLLVLVALGTIFWRRQWRSQAVFWLWPLSVLIFILFYRITGQSLLVPYQRNLYYLVLALPYLSAFGLMALWLKLKPELACFRSVFLNQLIVQSLAVILGLVVFLVASRDYRVQPSALELYRVIDKQDYFVLREMASWPTGKVMANPFVGTALPALTPHRPVASIYFQRRHKEEVIEFFVEADCARRRELIEKHRVRYVWSEVPLECSGVLIYGRDRYIYQTELFNNDES